MPLILIASAIVGCRSATPAAVAPSIEAWSTFGLSCGERRADNVPSGLFQWTCRSDHRGIPLTLLVDGDDHGVFMMTAQVPGGTDPRAAGQVFDDLVGASLPLTTVRAEVGAWLRAWDGVRSTISLGDASLSLERDRSWVTLAVFPGPRHSVNDPVRGP
ncbi:MAG: hypothetical protein E6I26_04395 [Chloroflexi bacterium]|nr:MAG: hypothetical protein E6I26_04395 [Chloroflexota bacterium]